MEPISTHSHLSVLWFTLTPSLYEVGNHHYHGCGWIESLQALMAKQSHINLAVSFFHPRDSEKVIREGTTYYPIVRKRVRNNPFKAVINNWRGVETASDHTSRFQEIIADFKPDVIHVFGTESTFGNLSELTNIPVVIHLQGILNPIVNAYFPAGHSSSDFKRSSVHFRENLIGGSPGFTVKKYKKRAEREFHIFAKAKHVMGRTHWDRMMVRLFNPDIAYYHVNEVLRPAFYKVGPMEKPVTQFQIVSTLSATVYKGIDVILKTAKELKRLTTIDFTWSIVGVDATETMLRHFENVLDIHHKDVQVVCVGRKDPEELISLLQDANVYVHPTYIDNSPNSVCEAQIMGTPVIACDVGGVSSLINHNETGFLVPSNGVFEIVHYLKKLYEDQELYAAVVTASKEASSLRHDPNTVVDQVLEVYKKMKASV